MTRKQHHLVFKVGHSGRARELCLEAVIRDPLTSKHLRLTRVIWDTGATGCMINSSVAVRMGLIPTGQTQVFTANGSSIQNTYVIDFHLPHGVVIGGLNVSDGNLGPNTEMLVGMDVISMGDFIVQNIDGKTEFAFCIPPFESKYDMIEKADKINKRIAKENFKNQKPPKNS